MKLNIYLRMIFRIFLVVLFAPILSGFSQVDSGFYYVNNIMYSKALSFQLKKIKTTKYIPENKLEKALDYYNLACAYSLNKKQEKCIEAIKKTISIDSSFRKSIYSEIDFYNMLPSQEWRRYLIACKNKDKLIMSDSLIVQLSKIAIQDQIYYREALFFEKKYGENSKMATYFWKLKDSLNNENLAAIRNYLSKNINVLSNQIVGQFFANKCFLVIQHSDLPTMIEFLPIIKRLYEKRETKGENYALLYDRVSVNTHKGKQYYGTQVNTETNLPYPIIDEKNVGSRRDSLGMVSLKKYLLEFGINYNPSTKQSR